MCSDTSIFYPEASLRGNLFDYKDLIKSDPIFKELESFETKRILEIGCGTGRITKFIAQNFQEVCGVDIAEEMIAKAKQRLGNIANVQLVATNGWQLPFPDNFFDAAFSFIVFQHMPDKETVRKNFEEISRVLKLDGLAKIQLRGQPTTKGTWFYGQSFDLHQANKIIAGLPLQVLKTTGEGERYFWLWLKKV